MSVQKIFTKTIFNATRFGYRRLSTQISEHNTNTSKEKIETDKSKPITQDIPYLSTLFKKLQPEVTVGKLVAGVGSIVGTMVGTAMLKNYQHKKDLDKIKVQNKKDLDKMNLQIDLQHKKDLEKYEKKAALDDARNFKKFMDTHHIPNAQVRFKIDRENVVKLLKKDILICSRSPRVYNIIAPTSIGKSITLQDVAKEIDGMDKYKVFYVNCENTLRQYLKDEYNLTYENDKQAIHDFVRNIKQYTQTPKGKNKEVIIIMDSPGGISEGENTYHSLIKRLKETVSYGYATVYAISSKPNNLFTQKRCEILGPSRYKETKSEDWINFDLTASESKEIIKKYLKDNEDCKFTNKQMSRLMSIKKIGDIVVEMSDIDRSNK